MHTKLTLRLDEGIIKKAKALANKKGKSLSQLVADYFASLDENKTLEEPELTPMVRALKGVLRGKDLTIKEYRHYLESKHR